MTKKSHYTVGKKTLDPTEKNLRYEQVLNNGQYHMEISFQVSWPNRTLCIIANITASGQVTRIHKLSRIFANLEQLILHWQPCSLCYCHSMNCKLYESNSTTTWKIACQLTSLTEYCCPRS